MPRLKPWIQMEKRMAEWEEVEHACLMKERQVEIQCSKKHHVDTPRSPPLSNEAPKMALEAMALPLAAAPSPLSPGRGKSLFGF